MKIEGEDSRYWHVREGSGMGLLPAGEISDATFHDLVERPFACDESIRNEFEVFVYCRF